MARPGVTYLDVANVAQQLVAAGRIPTIESIRITLGTGSNSTLGNHLRIWKSKQDQTQQVATKENIPKELIAALKGVWERVMNQSDEKIQTSQQESQLELMTLKQEIQRLQKDNAYWQQQHQQIKKERDGFAHEKTTIEQLLTHAKIEIATLNEKIAGLELQSQQKQERIEELRRQNQQIQANLEHYRNASLEQRIADQNRYEQQIKQLEQTIQQTGQEFLKTQHEKSMFQQKNQHLIFENDSLKKQLEKLNENHGSINDRLADALNELGRKAQDQQHWQEQFQALQAKYDEQNKSFMALQPQHFMLSRQSETMKAELKEVREQNKLLAHEKWELGQEKAQLYGQLKQLESSFN